MYMVYVGTYEVYLPTYVRSQKSKTRYNLLREMRGPGCCREQEPIRPGRSESELLETSDDSERGYEVGIVLQSSFEEGVVVRDAQACLILFWNDRVPFPAASHVLVMKCTPEYSIIGSPPGFCCGVAQVPNRKLKGKLDSDGRESLAGWKPAFFTLGT